MIYLGSKAKIAKKLLEIILPYRENRIWVEPFVGGGNMIDKVSNSRIGNDSNPYVIALLKAIQNGWKPPTNVSKEQYYEIKNNINNYPLELVAFVAFTCSFGAKWWGGYAFNNKGTNYAEQSYRNLMKQAPLLQGVEFQCKNYYDMQIPNNALIYCDPPYENTTKYSSKFDHNRFWQWCRDMSKTNMIFISEYNAPQDFTCISTIAHKTVLNKNKNDSRIEKVFTYVN